MPNRSRRRNAQEGFTRRIRQGGYRPRIAMSMGEARDGQQEQSLDIAPKAIDGGSHIMDGSLDMGLFAESIIPPRVVTALPALPDADYPQGSLVFLTTDEKLYRNTDGSTWSLEVDGADIADGTIEADKIVANSLTAGQIAAGAIGTTELAADAVIANVVNVGGTVTIDDDGIAITDGALSFLDQFGATVLTGAGFGATWMDFIDTHVYNHAFRAGTTASITAATEVSGADSDADYLASLSSDIPYWVVGSESGTGTLARVSASQAPGGFAIEWRDNETAEIYQDIPVSPGQRYSVYISWRRSTCDASNELSLTVGCQFRGPTHEDLGLSVVESSLTYITSMADYETEWVNQSGVAPSEARYMRVFIGIARVSGNPVARLGAVMVMPNHVYGDQKMVNGDSIYTDGHGSEWEDSGGTVDIALRRISANTLGVVNPAGPLNANLQTTGNVTVGGHLIIGDNTEIRFGDGNDIQMIYDEADNRIQFSGTVAFQDSGAAIRIPVGYIAMAEISAPTNAPSNEARLFVRDNGAGKTQFCARFPSGSVQVIATEP